MDDIVFTWNDLEMSRLKKKLSEEFEIKDLGASKVFPRHKGC